ncbi:MAG: hypothetical protein L0Y57_09365 [Beijerinckiaceae bacterium]|nr:hypothetical protein [Beijerinckiaceae bacterium]
MPRASILGNIPAIVSVTALFAFFLGGPAAEARGVGIGRQAQAAPPSGRAVNAPALLAPMPLISGDEIVAERTQIKLPASEAGSLLEDLRLQLQGQPGALLYIRWQLTRPAQPK